MALHRLVYLLLPWIALSLHGASPGTDTPPAAAVLVHADGELHNARPAGSAVQDALQAAGISLRPGDILLHDGLPVAREAGLPPGDGLVLQVIRAAELTWEGGRISTAAGTVGEALWEAGVHLRIGDLVDPSPQTALLGDMEVRITRARPVRVAAGGVEITFWSAARTVGEALLDGGMSLQGLDYSQPAPDAPVPGDGGIRLVRVEEDILLERAGLPFDTLIQPSSDLEIDRQQVIQTGSSGLQVTRIRVRYENGVETGRAAEAEWVAVEPQPRIVAYGTQIVIRTLDTPDGQVEYWRAVQAFATSYSPCRLGTDFCGETTASGLPLVKGLVAVIRPWYNAMVFSQVYVPGYGVGVIADIGAGVPGQHWIDLGYSDDDWKGWAKTVTVYFLTPVPPADQILWLLP